jgi:glycosyltransferase involved in cell wall biosynthesis
VRSSVFHGPANIAGIGRHLADWQRKQGHLSDFISFDDPPIVDPAHIDLKLRQYRILRWYLVQIALFLLCLVHYKYFHFYFGRSLLPFNLDLPILRLFGKKIVMTYCGSEARLIGVEAKRNPFWKLLTIGRDHPKYDWLKRWMMRWHRLWVHKVIAPRNLYASAIAVFPPERVVGDVWLHNTIEIDDWKPSYETRTPPLVVHAPSEVGIKGTRYVEQAIHELESMGIPFRYRRLENLGHGEALRVLREEADIVVDQLLLGGFGTLAVGAMAFGKPVIGYLIDSVKSEHYPDCPIVSATIHDVKEKLRDLIARPEERVQLGRKGRAFVERHFDRERVNRAVWRLYQSL